MIAHTISHSPAGLWEIFLSREVSFVKKKILLMLSYVLVAAMASSVTLYLTYSDGSPKLQELSGIIDDYYVEDVDITAAEDAAAHAMVGALGDRWSYYIPASEYQTYLEQAHNAYVGVGITIAAREDGLGFDILTVEDNGPAFEAGILPGDILVGVEGQNVADMTATEVRNLVRGEEGTYVNLAVTREEQELFFKVQRRELQMTVAEGQMVGDDVGMVVIYNFDDRCAEESIAAIESLIEQGAKKLVFDVRFNGGGYAHEMVALLDYLLPAGDLFRTVNYAGKEAVDTSDDKCLDMPMAVLVNGDSYSAAELFAAALQEYEAAVVVGEQTSGKGYYQNTFSLSDGSAVGLSTGKYFTPLGVSLEGVGITPDVIIEVDEQTAAKIYSGSLDYTEDSQLQAAIKQLQ